jgi:DNA helicase II / ATP-dependent DNA helicase PcrA
MLSFGRSSRFKAVFAGQLQPAAKPFPMDYALPGERARDEIPPIDFRAELNDEQYAAVTAEPGPLLVLAGAGSGKTRTLTYRVAYLLSRGVRPGEILLLTFTNKAAKEMLARVEELTGVEAHRFWGGTFHHIGHRILRQHGSAVGLERSFTILDADEAESLLREAVDAIDSSFFKDKSHPRARVLGDIISLARNTRTTLEETLARQFSHHQTLIDRIVAFANAYRERKRKAQMVDYDDLLELWLRLLEVAPELAETFRQRFRHTLVDEYQDTNALQSRIVDMMASDHRVMAVGDDAQCIYSWRGADFENIISFPDRHPGTVIHRIETNYRSSPEILTLANSVLRSQAATGRGFEKELKPARSSQGKPYYVPALDAREIAQFIISRIHGLVDEGRGLRDVAILYRAHFQALDLQIELSRANIPYHITSGVRFFEQAHVRDLVAQLRFVYNPNDSLAFQRVVVLLPKVGEKGARKLFDQIHEVARDERIDPVDAMLAESVRKKVPKDAKADWESLGYSLRDVRDAIRGGQAAEAVQLATEGWYGVYLKGAFANYGSRLDDLKSLIGFAGRFEDVQDMLAQITLLNSETSDRSVDAKDDAVRLTTVHQAKGLEYDVVFVIGLADGMFPLKRAIEENNIEEERRLFYVAVTRARDELYLCYPRVSAKGGPIMSFPPSRFLGEIPAELRDEVRLRRGW